MTKRRRRLEPLDPDGSLPVSVLFLYDAVTGFSTNNVASVVELAGSTIGFVAFSVVSLESGVGALE